MSTLSNRRTFAARLASLFAGAGVAALGFRDKRASSGFPASRSWTTTASRRARDLLLR